MTLKQINNQHSIHWFLIFLLSINLSCTERAEPVGKAQKRPQVALLGMLHFVSKNNTVSQQFTEVDNDEIQREISDLVDKLAQYQPTKIAVERPYRSEEELNKRYQEYLRGDYPLTHEETDQIAFRLGKKLGHKKLYLAYAPVEFDFESAMEFAHQNSQAELTEAIISNARELANTYDSIASNRSLMEALYYLNSPEAIDKNHLGYLLTVQIGNKENPIGAEVVGDWYKSNLKIFKNIGEVAYSPADKVLVLYGQGHLKILNQLVEDSPQLDLVEISKYLQ